MNTLQVLAVLAAIVGVSHGLSCFVCNETALAKGDTCGDPFDPTSANSKTYVVKCIAPHDKFCAKEKTGSDKVVQHVERYCADQCEDLNLVVHKKTCCSTDQCNTASSLWRMSSLLLFILASLMAYFHH